MGHIFISYSHKDSSYVHKLTETLEKEGFQVWIDDRIHYGSEWPRVVTRNLDVSDGVIVVLSNNSYESDMVQNEVTRAREKKKPIFPLLLEGENWLIVQAKQFVDVRDGSLPIEKFYKRLEEITPRKNERAEREVAEKAAREKAKKDTAEKERLEAEEQARQKSAREKKEREVAEKITQEKAESEKAKKDAKEKAQSEEIKKRRLPYYETSPLEKPAHEELKRENQQAKKTKPQRKLNTAIVVALVGLIGTICVALLGILGTPYFVQLFSPEAIATPTKTSPPNYSDLEIVSVIGAGTLNAEWVVVRNAGAESLNLTGWQLKDSDRNVFTFPNLTLNGGGAVQIHTIAGTNTVIDLYWSLANPVWESGEIALLYDPLNNLHSSFRVP